MTRTREINQRISLSKVIAIICIIILIVNIVLFSFRIYSSAIMWIVIILIAIIAFPGMKLIKRSEIKTAVKSGRKK